MKKNFVENVERISEDIIDTEELKEIDNEIKREFAPINRRESDKHVELLMHIIEKIEDEVKYIHKKMDEDHEMYKQPFQILENMRLDFSKICERLERIEKGKKNIKEFFDKRLGYIIAILVGIISIVKSFWK